MHLQCDVIAICFFSFDHQAIKKYLLRPGRALINPFDPSHTEIRLTSNRRRWTHIFPKSSNNSTDIFPRNSESNNADVLNMISALHNVIPEDPDLDSNEGNFHPTPCRAPWAFAHIILFEITYVLNVKKESRKESFYKLD